MNLSLRLQCEIALCKNTPLSCRVPRLLAVPDQKSLLSYESGVRSRSDLYFKSSGTRQLIALEDILDAEEFAFF